MSDVCEIYCVAVCRDTFKQAALYSALVSRLGLVVAVASERLPDHRETSNLDGVVKHCAHAQVNVERMGGGETGRETVRPRLIVFFSLFFRLVFGTRVVS